MAPESTVRAPGLQPPEQTSLIYHAGRVICRVVTTQMFDLKVYGTHHVPRSGGVLIVSNHQSYLDPVLLAAKIRRPISFLAKSELFDVPGFGWLIRRLNAFPVRLGEGDVGAVKETIRRLQEGRALNMYPEGSRSSDGEIAAMQAGIGLIVRRAGVPVLPAVVDGSFRAWPRGTTIFRSRPIRVQYGPVMDLKDLKAAEIVKRIDATLRRMFEELRERVRHENASR